MNVTYNLMQFQSTRPHGARLKGNSINTVGNSFNPRAHMGRDPDYGSGKWKTNSFNPRAHMGRDRCSAARCVAMRSFNPRAHMGRDTRWSCSLRSCASFNPRAHMGRDSCRTWTMRKATRFNPRAHMGRDILEILPYSWSKVSIHAPTWGATDSSTTAAATVKFQSTRPHGARLFARVYNRDNQRFQSTRPHGARRAMEEFTSSSKVVSIHAPTWGATRGGAKGSALW